MVGLVIVAVALLTPEQESESHREADALLQQYGTHSEFPAMLRDSLATFIEVEKRYEQGDYSAAKRSLDSLWSRYPVASPAWQQAYGEHAAVSERTGINIGLPSCYYALRMYDECLTWRVANPRPPMPVATATLTVVLVGTSEGIEPRNQQELLAGDGHRVHNSLHPALARDPSAILDESVELFSEYTLAASQGKLAVKTEIVRLNSLTVPVSVKDQFAGLSGNAISQIWQAIPEKTLDQTDWWWVIYPSHVPERHPDFVTTEFITGGMGSGPDGNSPCFISDDRWLMRKPPHLGKGAYTEIERRAYLPQWLQHEMAHHWFRTWPEFELEKSDHQWFDRRTWPADFVGLIEPDYYANALNLRIQPQANPPMHLALLYAKPSVDVLRKVTVADLIGRYEHQPRENDWHSGTITSENGQLVWTNEAGARWNLRWETDRGRMNTGNDCPYFDSESGSGPAHHLVLERGADGRHVPRVRGFTFQGGLYQKQ